MTELAVLLNGLPRVGMATLPTPLEVGPELPGGARLYVKRDDLSGLGMGGNKARKLEYLCGDALAQKADVLVTVGAAQSNHARMTAAAGAVLGIETHVLLGGLKQAPSGNQLLSSLFGAELHFCGSDDWDELEQAMDELIDELARAGRRPYRVPIGGSTAVGATGFAGAWPELMAQCETLNLRPALIVHASSSAGTHGGLLAGRAAMSPNGPPILAIAVAKTGLDLRNEAAHIARACLDRLQLSDVDVRDEDIEVDERWRGPDYAVPTKEADAAIIWAARRGGLVLDRVYTGKAFAGMLGAAEEGRLESGETVIFWHTGGQPAVFAPGGAPELANTISARDEAGSDEREGSEA